MNQTESGSTKPKWTELSWTRELERRPIQFDSIQLKLKFQMNSTQVILENANNRITIMKNNAKAIGEIEHCSPFNFNNKFACVFVCVYSPPTCCFLHPSKWDEMNRFAWLVEIRRIDFANHSWWVDFPMTFRLIQLVSESIPDLSPCNWKFKQNIPKIRTELEWEWGIAYVSPPNRKTQNTKYKIQNTITIAITVSIEQRNGNRQS